MKVPEGFRCKRFAAARTRPSNVANMPKSSNLYSHIHHHLSKYKTVCIFATIQLTVTPP